MHARGSLRLTWKREIPVGHTLSLLTATLLVAQTPDANVVSSGKTCSCQKNAATVGYVQPVPAELAPNSSIGTRRSFFSRGETTTVSEDRPFLSRLQNLFGRRQSDNI